MAIESEKMRADAGRGGGEGCVGDGAARQGYQRSEFGGVAGRERCVGPTVGFGEGCHGGGVLKDAAQEWCGSCFWQVESDAHYIVIGRAGSAV